VTALGGAQAVAALRRHRVDALFTLSGAHIFPLYEEATTQDPPLRLIDVRHEQTAVFAAEGLARLTRRPAVAAVTAGPGVTNSVSAITSAWFNGAPLVVLGGRAPQYRWGTGALQELDQPPLLQPVTKSAHTITTTARIGSDIDQALTLASTAPRGPVFVDIPMDVLFEGVGENELTPYATAAPRQALEGDPSAVVDRLASAERPLIVLGSDVWLDGASDSAASFVAATGIPTITNGMARGVIPADHPLLVNRARREATRQADVVMVVGTALDFRLGYGVFGPRDHPADVIHVVDSPERLATHVTLAGYLTGPLPAALGELANAWTTTGRTVAGDWTSSLQRAAEDARALDDSLLADPRTPLHPARIYGELVPRLDPSAVVVGDGGDFVSFAGRFIEPARPGHWLDPGPFGCLGSGLGHAIAARLAYPDSPVVLLLGDGAAGMSLMDVDTLVRHDLPVVIIVGNNSAWGLELHPMRLLYGTDTAATLRHGTRYDDVVRALGGAGETVTTPDELGPALDRAFASGVPYLVNVVTDAEVAYPRSTTGL